MRSSALLPAALYVLLSLGVTFACTSDRERDREALTPQGTCADQPGTVPRPPEGSLPCELIPPGLHLSK